MTFLTCYFRNNIKQKYRATSRAVKLKVFFGKVALLPTINLVRPPKLGFLIKALID